MWAEHCDSATDGSAARCMSGISDNAARVLQMWQLPFPVEWQRCLALLSGTLTSCPPVNFLSALRKDATSNDICHAISNRGQAEFSCEELRLSVPPAAMSGSCEGVAFLQPIATDLHSKQMSLWDFLWTEFWLGIIIRSFPPFPPCPFHYLSTSPIPLPLHLIHPPSHCLSTSSILPLTASPSCSSSPLHPFPPIFIVYCTELPVTKPRTVTLRVKSAGSLCMRLMNMPKEVYSSTMLVVTLRGYVLLTLVFSVFQIGTKRNTWSDTASHDT